ncbi:hypothetical protein BX265_1825 [Streptomyces sp. TLI_235]|nr:hypothetical protein [Streptomyces sp. TLI_235]PBC77088.1 hypothetical protein BX265_1825 [Streptomyces sp. TLI_235]
MVEVFQESGIPAPADGVGKEEPLSSELQLVFEPTAIPFLAAFSDGFINELQQFLGPGLSVQRYYSTADLRRYVDKAGVNSTTEGLNDAVTPSGFEISPAGRLQLLSPPVTVNKVRCTASDIIVSVSGKTDDCETAARDVIKCLDKVANINRGWPHYEGKLIRRHAATSTYVKLPGNLREYLDGSPLEKVFRDVVEPELAQLMEPKRIHPQPEVKFTKVLVHQVDCWVSVVNSDGITNSFRLEFDHTSDEQIADRGMLIASELDYDSHMRLVQALRDSMNQKGRTEG